MATTNLGRIGLVSRGTWSAGTYKNLDVVSYNNSLYICKVTTTTDAPTVTASWDLYVSDSGAAASASNAASSATAAAASYDSFDDRYLGAKTSDPSVDNDGNALLTGALYWNSATGVFKVWSGSAWITNITSNQFGTNVATFLQTPSSANLAAALTDETGTGVAVFASNPTFPAQINLTANSGYNINASGTANNYLAGSLGIGGVPVAGYKVLNYGSWTGASSFSGFFSQGTIQSDVTATSYSYRSAPNTAAASFTLNSLIHYVSEGGVKGAGSTISNQYGFFADSTLTGAVNNYGFYGAIAAGTGRYNLYMGGTAPNYMAGRLGIGTAAGTNVSFRVAMGITGSTFSSAITSDGTIKPDVTSRADMFLAAPYTEATAFTLSRLVGYKAQLGAIGAGSEISTAAAFEVDSGWTGATNNYGFYGAIAAGTGRYNLFMEGTAPNYMAGSLGIGTSSPDASAILDAQSTTKGVRMPNMTTTQKNAIASPAAGLMVFDTTLAKLCVHTGAAWQTITSV